jgi:hypothetical protein
MSVGVMKDYKLKLRDLHASHTLGFLPPPSAEFKKITKGIEKDRVVKTMNLFLHVVSCY